MSLRSDIRDSLRTAHDLLCETWQYRRLTSGPAASARTYGSWTDMLANATGRAAPQEWDDVRRVWKRAERLRIRVSDTLADLHQGDQVKDPDSTVYAVGGVASNAPNTGTVSYECERSVPLKAEAESRNGGV